MDVGHEPTVVLCAGVRARHEDSLPADTSFAVPVARAPALLKVVLKEFVILIHVKGVAISRLASHEPLVDAGKVSGHVVERFFPRGSGLQVQPPTIHHGRELFAYGRAIIRPRGW